MHRPVTDELSLLSLNYTSGTTGTPKGAMYSQRGGAYLQPLTMAAQTRLTPQALCRSAGPCRLSHQDLVFLRSPALLYRASYCRAREVVLVTRTIGLAWSYPCRPGQRWRDRTTVGTVAACGFGGVLYKVITSPQVLELLKAVIARAFKLSF